MSTITITSRDNAQSVASKVDSAQSGDIVQFTDGVDVDLGGTVLSLHAGVKLQGNYPNAVLRWSGLTGNNRHGIAVDANASGCTLDGLDMYAPSGGVLRFTAGAPKLTVIGCGIQADGGTFAKSSQMIFGIWGVGATNLNLAYNYFHDSNAGRCYEIWAAQNAVIEHNLYYNVIDGGHFMEPQDNCSFSFNYATRLRRMLQEIQGNTASHNLRVVGNVAYDWVSPYYNSFGLSVVNDKAINTSVDSNFIELDIASGSSWGPKDSGGTNRFGYAIEIGGANPTGTNNTLIVRNTAGAGMDTSCASTARGNRIYAAANVDQWGDFATEPGPSGQGSYVNASTLTQDNVVDHDIADAPSNPGNTFAGAAFRTSAVSSSTTPAASTTGGITGLSAKVLSDTTVQLSWTSVVSNPIVNVITTVGRQSFPPIQYNDSRDCATIVNLHPGWQLDFNVSSGSLTAGPSTVLLTGSSSAAVVGDPKGIVSTQILTTYTDDTDSTT